MQDTIMGKICSNLTAYFTYLEWEQLLYTCNNQDDLILCLPKAIHEKYKVIVMVLDQAHTFVGYTVTQQTLEYLQY